MLLATDLDGTFLAGDPEDRLSLYQTIAAHPEIKLAYVTGRSLEAVLPLLADPTLPQPDYIIADVGATLVHGDSLQPIQPLQSLVDAHWPGESQVASAIESFGLERQDVPQARRCSYFCTPEQAANPALREAAEQLGCDLLYSAELYLDFLPRGVNKGSSLKALADWLELNHDQVLAAGDTLNDLSMLSASFHGVCVGQSEGALLEATRHHSRTLHANRPGCGGILEAFAHFGFLGEHGIAAERRQAAQPGKSELVMVYHRLPYEEYRNAAGKLQRRRPTSPNGIIPTLLSFFGDGRPGSWVAWAVHEDDDEPFDSHTTVDAERYPKLTAARVKLSKEEVDIFYKRFSKEAFWPTLHTFWERATFNEDDWQIFLKVNRAFAERTALEAAEGAIVWLHDYNLWMVPAYLRELRPDLRIAFFHHTYFPSADVFNVLPWRRQIVGSLLQCDYIGFHIPRQVENFVDVARGVFPLKTLERQNCAPRFITYGCAVGLERMTTALDTGTRQVKLGAHPVGLDIDRVRSALEAPKIKELMGQLREEMKGVKLILSVERLDYTKGILEKLNAYERLLADNPELIGKVTLVTVCVPAAKEMTIYDELQTQIEQAVGRINGRFARIGWTPLQFFFRSLPFEEVSAWYAMADVMWITPLRDGLNLVAKEFVAAQGLLDGRGVLVLSEFAGAAAELKGALLTNPHDPADLAQTCYLALNLPKSEAQARLRELFDIVCYNDIRRWGEEFLAGVQLQQEPEPLTLVS
ncbi:MULTISPECIES: glucosylglycerol-phosphate synthase [Pseudomonas]|uniref:Glucosylglycerol-phosphate synthase n=2 Tax=Ectopseudomonas TaxID=3236654 RepID=A0A653B076_ECTOL|nr:MULTISPECIES: glucosylglycerol-phosphate synthase [Pseudomonas]TNF09742.1 MAG: glucosylglycerol-phosphate synthase [Pseudomonadales bacterium]CAE6943541.1 Glucosylglycerol-phosphate synthase [Pseudomonas oleovorans]QTS85149.1 glucosylglycerol-phosphate synthase [Pseudomonas khazarica]WFC63748.1 glucosylglycerol-phosphate synthase [Pseudomonas sp. REST10]HIQ43478.1 glucosylglycerol-phosphate synthase [Pseudomonas oleovorans]|tara:strand:- start:7121 stop:9379 length:2259 start_codon:yes stop_codon:yes gene_type:complete